MKTIKLTSSEIVQLIALVEDHTSSKKNWLVTAVENGDTEKAQKHAKDIRELQSIRTTLVNA